MERTRTKEAQPVDDLLSSSPWQGGERPGGGSLALAIPLATYFLLVLTIWGPFALCSGMPYETSFLYTSETTGNQAFFYTADPLRIHTNTFYHLSFLLGEAIGLNGSFVPFQIVYAILWWARGVLVFLILRKFLRYQVLLCFLAGSLTIVHAADGALQWVGQLNQFGFMFWMLLGFYFFLCSTEQAKLSTAIPFLAAACLFEYMSLWSYEAQLFLVVAAPLTLFLRRPALDRRLLAFIAVWYTVPVTYAVLTVQKYLASRDLTYQVSVMRPDWDVGSLLNDLGFNMYASLAFWDWTRNVTTVSNDTVLMCSLLAVLWFICGGIAMLVLGRRDAEADGLPAAKYAALLITAVVLLALSFPVYLLLASARSLWRTQMLSGIAAALVFTALIGLVTWSVKSARYRPLLALVLGSVTVFYGSAAAVQLGSNHASAWEKQRSIMEEILEALPSVESPAMVLVVGLPRQYDGFGHNMWFDFALRLAYPDVELAGTLVYEDHTVAPGANMKLDGDNWVWDGTAYPPLIREVPASRTVVLRYTPEKAVVLGEVPPPLLGSHEPIRPLVPIPKYATPARVANRYLFRPACCEWVQQGVGP